MICVGTAFILANTILTKNSVVLKRYPYPPYIEIDFIGKFKVVLASFTGKIFWDFG